MMRPLTLAAALAASSALTAWSLPAAGQTGRPAQYFPIAEVAPPAVYHAAATAAPARRPAPFVRPQTAATAPTPAPSFANDTAPAPASGQDRVVDLPAPGSEGSERAVITADELTHDKGLDTVTARGGVEIHYAGRLLMADTVSYQITKDHATASGNVTVVEPDGTTLFADYVELENELKEGLIQEIRLLLKDGSRAAARQAVRAGDRTVMSQGVYSACDSCTTDPSRPLTWQIKAMRVVHDQKTKDITYRDAWMEVFGVPVAYTPYLSHPDPTVERRSGLLAPSYGGTRDLGFTLKVPYYYVISPHQDVTLAPMITTDEGFVLSGEHRLAFDRGRIVSEGSITKDSEGRVRNHLFAKGEIDLDSTWRAGADINLASDETYLRRYGFDSSAFLTTRPYLEGFSQRSYTLVEAYYFQDMLNHDDKVIDLDPPIVAPTAGWHYVSAPGQQGGWHTADVSTAVISRTDGPDSRRLTAEYGWHLPYTSPLGEVYRLDLSLRGDAYHVEDVPNPAGGANIDGATGRLIPTAALTWSLPLERSHTSYHEVIEPIVMGVISPRGQNLDRVPNEDSLDFEFDETSLFQIDRFPGYDRIENGPRINYGLRYSAYGSAFGRLGALIGQSWRAWPDGGFRPGSGMDEQFSDYVGRVTLRPNDNLDMVYRFRLDKDTLEAKRNNLSLAVGPPILRLGVDYLSLEGTPLDEGGAEPTDSLSTSLTSAFSRYWTARMHARYDLTEDGGPLSVGGGLSYEDECLRVDLSGAREYTYDRDYEGGYRVGLRLVLKTLGEVQTSAGQ